MELNVTGAFIYFTIPIFGGIPITQTTVSSFLVTLLLIFASIHLGKNLKKRPDGVQVLVEKGVTMLYGMVGESMGEHNLHWTPFIGTIFLSSICGSFIGLTGFLRSSTADLSCVMVWALMVSIIIWYNNISRDGVGGWLKGFTEPIVVMTPMNIIGEIAQPVSMAFRHFGNVAGGGVITSILYVALSGASAALLNAVAANGILAGVVLLVVGIVLLVLNKSKWHKKRFLILGIACSVIGLFGVLQATGILSGVPVLAFGIPAVLSCYFDLFSGFVQAYVFTLLTMVYIGNSLPAPETKAEAEAA
ncbi:MAG: F0F1 ATP synthase subunit A [Clostridia bacterium]|nr:F0F1 ATP synthase subunit A [Clostridia bacterium]